MLRTIIAFVIFTSTINAEPIPKNADSKISAIFGTILQNSKECRVSLTKKRALLIEQSRDHKLFHFALNSTDQPKPYLAKAAELQGDFTITIRCKIHLSKKATCTLAQVHCMTAELPTAAAGLAIYNENVYMNHVYSVHNSDQIQTAGFASTSNRSDTTYYDSVPFIDKPIYVKVTRNGHTFTHSHSTDGAKYRVRCELKIKTDDTKFHIGPLFYHNTDITCSAEFDEFTIEPLEKK